MFKIWQQSYIFQNWALIWVLTQINAILEYIKKCGVHSERIPFDGDMPDEDDRVFYEVSLSKEDSFLVTGNLKHFSKTPKVITAAQMMEILDNEF